MEEQTQVGEAEGRSSFPGQKNYQDTGGSRVTTWYSGSDAGKQVQGVSFADDLTERH